MIKLPGEHEFTSMDASQHLVPVDSEVIVRTGGGGGWGDPLDRDAELVRADVVEGFVSAEKAFSEYAVVLDPRNGAVDVAATQHLRSNAKSKQKSQTGEGRS